MNGPYNATGKIDRTATALPEAEYQDLIELWNEKKPINKDAARKQARSKYVVDPDLLESVLNYRFPRN